MGAEPRLFLQGMWEMRLWAKGEGGQGLDGRSAQACPSESGSIPEPFPYPQPASWPALRAWKVHRGCLLSELQGAFWKGRVVRDNVDGWTVVAEWSVTGWLFCPL